MPPKTQTLKCRRIIAAAPAAAYNAFTSGLALREWFCDSAQVDARPGGRLYAWWNSGYYAAGQFSTLAPAKKIAFTWQGRGEPAETEVQVTFRESKSGVSVAVAHSGVWSGRKWAAAVAEFEKGWAAALENLQSTLETGQDLRFVRRPMLGINVGDFNAGEAAKLGVPVAEGVLLDSVAEGMGAQAAGLQKGDVVVSIGGSKAAGFASLAGLLQNFRAGDRVPVTYYRGPEKRTTTMTLSQRPLPDTIPDAAGLAAHLAQTYAEVQAARAECFAGATDAEAAAKPAPDEWSAKETLAHLLTGERDQASWIASLVTGQDVPEGIDNLDARYSAVAAAYSLPEMLEVMRQAEAETVALVAGLPPAFVERKASYWRVVFNLLQPAARTYAAPHTYVHLDQMRAALAAARGAQQ